MKDLYVIKEGKKLRCGYTTGSCATAAAKAASIGLMTGQIPRYIQIDTPAGVELNLKVEKPYIKDGVASCCIVKDAGDDPDVTDGIAIYAQVTKRKDDQIMIDGGEGVGRITREGFWGKVGEAAINPTPRRMIKNEVKKVVDTGVDVTIYVPQGKEIAKKTYNSHIGIVEGISIIGTSGIVEPMSEDALKKSIYMEIDAYFDQGVRHLILVPGKYGENMVDEMKLLGNIVKVSNYIGDVLLYCHEKGIKKITLVGNIGKLCKLSIGVFNTHSRTADTRIESFIYYLSLAKAPYDLLLEVQKALTAEEALEIVIDAGYQNIVKDMNRGCVERIRKYIKDDLFDIDVITYSMKFGVL